MFLSIKIENNKLWTKLDHGLGVPRPENRLPNKGTLNFKVLFAKSSGSTIANIKSAEELFTDDRVRIRKVTQSPMGKLYILTDELNGKLIRIRNAAF